MAFPPGPFHVYINGGKLLVTFPSRSTADEYWRSVQEKMDPKQQSPRYRRYHSQYYSAPRPDHDGHEADVAATCIIQEFIPAGGWIGRPEERIVPLPAPTAGGDQRPDNVNGGKFYIRSTVRPKMFWYFDPTFGRCIKLSSSRQTKFAIRRATPLPFECHPGEDILIGRDDINIFVYLAKGETGREERMIVKDPQGRLVSAPVQSQEELGTFKFRMFDGGFGVLDNESSWEGMRIDVSSSLEEGERWEFVR